MITHNQGHRPLFGPASQTSYGLDWQRKSHPSSISSPIDDAQGMAYDTRKNLSIGPSIFRGRVVDSVAYTHCYRVMLERNGGVILCMAMTSCGMLPVGPRPISSIGPGSEVYVLRPTSGGYGIILGGIPAALTSPELAISDFVHQSSRCGLRVDKTHSAPFGTVNHGSLADWSNGRPFDGLSVGEWGAITETGLRLFLDPFMAQLAVDEATGVFAFYHDQLLRLAGYNTQMFSGGHEVEIYVDQREVHHYDGFTPYPWEQCGALTYDADPYREVVPMDVQFNQAHYGAWEPLQDDQLPFHRSLQFRGYLGQGGKRMVQAPPASQSQPPGQGGEQPPGQGGEQPPSQGGSQPPSQGGGDQGQGQTLSANRPNLYSQQSNEAALFEENLGLDGRYSLRSAKSIHIAKRVAIPSVNRMKRVEDATGDNEKNYMFAGVSGGGPAHKVTGEIRAESEFPHLQQAAGIMDVHAWVFNWLGAHPFHYHEQDWSVQEETDTFAKKVEEPISFGALAGEFYLPRPQSIPRKVDHRYNEVQYYPNQAYINMSDDGGVSIGDGYGAEIRMCGGHIFFTAPGDIWAKPGRNFNVLAGRDACFRAYNSMDLSSTKHDLRLKAERNLHLLGGNDGQSGGVLVECKAASSYNYADVVGEDVSMGGFQVKVPYGDAVIWSSNIYLRTGGGDVRPGIITIDAAKGQQPITFHANTITSFVSESILDCFGQDGNIDVTHVWSASSNIIGSGCCIQGPGIFQSSVLVRGWLEAVAGHVATELADTYKNKVPALQGESLFRAYEALADCQKGADDTDQAARTFWTQVFDNYLYADKQAGNDDTIRAVHFTFRNPAQYRTEEFTLFEDRWQQLARLGGAWLDSWDEKPVTGASSEDTMPYPGKKPWKDDDTYMEMDLSLYDPEKGVSLPRTKTPADTPEVGPPTTRVTEDKYEDPKFEEPKPKPPADGYLIIT